MHTLGVVVFADGCRQRHSVVVRNLQCKIYQLSQHEIKIENKINEESSQAKINNEIPCSGQEISYHIYICIYKMAKQTKKQNNFSLLYLLRQFK